MFLAFCLKKLCYASSRNFVFFQRLSSISNMAPFRGSLSRIDCTTCKSARDIIVLYVRWLNSLKLNYSNTRCIFLSFSKSIHCGRPLPSPLQFSSSSYLESGCVIHMVKNLKEWWYQATFPKRVINTGEWSDRVPLVRKFALQKRLASIQTLLINTYQFLNTSPCQST